MITVLSDSFNSDLRVTDETLESMDGAVSELCGSIALPHNVLTPEYQLCSGALSGDITKCIFCLHSSYLE